MQEDGQSVGRCTVTSLPNFLRWVDFLIYGAPLARASFGVFCFFSWLIDLLFKPFLPGSNGLPRKSEGNSVQRDWTGEQISYLPFLPVENSSTCEHSVAHLTTLCWPCAWLPAWRVEWHLLLLKNNHLFSLITFYWSHVLFDLYFSSSRLKWIAYEKWR